MYYSTLLFFTYSGVKNMCLFFGLLACCSYRYHHEEPSQNTWNESCCWKVAEKGAASEHVLPRPRSMSCLASCLANTLETCSPNVSQKPQVYKSHSSASNPQSNSILIKIQTPRQDSFSFFIRIVLSQQSQCKLAFFAQANGTLVQLHINVNCLRGASHRNYVRPVGLRIAAN